MKLGDSSDRFVRTVHIRLVALRALEGAGIGAATAAALGAVLVAVLMFEGRSTWEVATAMLVMGAVAGFGWGMVRRPNRLAAAAEADRQLGLQDLLASAQFVMRANAGDAWGDSVVRMADVRCEALSPSTLVLNRLGARAWGGIGLSVALMVTLAAMSTLPGSSQAGNEASRDGVRSARARADDGMQSTDATATEKHAAAPVNAAESFDPSHSSVTATSPDDGRDGRSPGASNSPGGGLAAGKTAASAVQPMKPGDTGRPRLEDGKNVSAGSGKAGDGKGISDADAAGLSVQNEPASIPVWRHQNWPRLREQALESMRSGRVPDSYGPVIREYFDQTVE